MSSLSQQNPSLSIDRNFVAKLWKWLARHEDVSIGLDKEYNNLTFEALEARFPGILDLSSRATSLPVSAEASAQPQAEPQQLVVSDSQGLAAPSLCNDGPRMSVSIERIYLAICGHGPDPTRVFPMEYALLCTIAATRHNGILQGELGRTTGQDKRSVPKRTDALQAKGYIVKRTAWIGGHKTSRLILRRFADQRYSSGAGGETTYTLRDVALQVFATLKENSFTTQDDLAMALSMTDPARSHVLSQVVRCLVQKKCLKKVRVAKGPGSSSDDLKVCIQTVREPVDSDWQKSEGDILDLSIEVDNALDTVRMEFNQADDDDAAGAAVDDNAHAPAQSSSVREPSGRPAWNPDRLLPNVLHELTTVAGEEGITNAIARRDITGLPVRRPIESLLTRLSHGSLKAQPPQTRDLCLVRSSETMDAVNRFVYRTVGSYQSLVQKRQASWSAVTGAEEFTKQLDLAPGPDPAYGYNKDEFGFIKDPITKTQTRFGQMRLDDLATMTRAASLVVRSNEPILLENTAGEVCLSWTPESTYDRRSRQSATPMKPPPSTKPPTKPRTAARKGQPGKGRRRKFTEGTQKFWHELFLVKMIQENPSYSKRGEVGLMSDPACLEMFNNRPSGLDEMVIKTLKNNLPVPLSPETVSQAWIDRMNMFFDRSTPGLYFAPSGAQNLSPTQLSCVVVIRSNRLGTIDLSDRRPSATVLFFASSVAHSHLYYRKDAWVAPGQHKEAAMKPKQVPKPRSRKRSKQASRPSQTPDPQPTSRPQSVVEDLGSFNLLPQRGQAPHRGSFVESVVPATPLLKVTAAGTREVRRSSSTTSDSGEDSDATASDPGMSSRLLSSVHHSGERNKADVQSSQTPAPDREYTDDAASGQGLLGRGSAYDSSVGADGRRRLADPETHAGFAKTKATNPIRKRSLQTAHTTPLLTYNPFRTVGDKENSASTSTSSAPTVPPRLARASQTSGLAENTSPTLARNITFGSLHADLLPASSAHNGCGNAEPTRSLHAEVPSPPSPHPSSSARVPFSTSEDVSEIAVDDSGTLTAYRGSAKQKNVIRNARSNALTLTQTPLPDKTTEVRRSDVAESAPGVAEPEAAEVSLVGPSNGVSAGSLVQHADPSSMTRPLAGVEHSTETPLSKTPLPKSTSRSKAPQPRTTQLLEGRHATKHYQRFILELIQMCGGVLPYGAGGPSMLKRAMKAKCVEAGVDSDPNVKQIRSGVNQLAQRGRAKVMHFTFQKNGFNHTKTVVALPHIQLTDGPLIAMQGKISSLPVEEDYVPPEIDTEAERKPSDTVSRTIDSDSEPAAARATQRKKRQSQPQRRRDSSTPATARRMSLSPPAPEPSLNVGFLTLKVPRIATIETQSTFTTKYFDLPAEPLQFNTDANALALQTAEPTPATQRRSGIRIPRNTKFNAQTRKIQWRVPKRTPLPTSLKAILAQDHRTEAEAAPEEHAILSAFERAVDFVATWEQAKYDDLQEQKPGTWNFINHLMPQNELTHMLRESELQFRLVQFEGGQEDAADHREIETDMPVAVSWDVFAQISARTKAKQKKATAATEKRKRKRDDIDGVDGDREDSDFDALDGEAAKPKRARRQPKASRIIEKRKAATKDDSRQRKQARMAPRGIGLRNLPQDQAHRIGIVFAVVKVLAGGLDRYVDFKLVARLLPEESETLLRERWKVLSTRYNNDIDALIQDVQIKYLDALADDRVPSVNFDDLQNTNWEGILAWANANINTKNKDLFREIPPTREELLTLNKLEVSEPPSLRNMYNISLNYTQGSREEAWCSVVLGSVPSVLPKLDGEHISPKFPQEDNEKDLAQARARSWVIAAVLTPEQNFNPAYTHKKLLKLAKDARAVDALLEVTMKKLQSDKIVIEKKNGESVVLPDGSILSGTHGWKVSNRYFDKFDQNRVITANMLREAFRYKLEVLDPAFAKDEPVLVSKEPDMEDGEMMAVFNLVSMGMLRIKPGSDVPASRYGLDWEDQGYKTRSMDKNVLSFSTILQPTSTYVEGDPLSPARSSVPVPRGSTDQPDGLGLIPAWFDINHKFQQYIWEMIVGAVIGIISGRPGILNGEIVRSLGWVLSPYDLDLVLQFLLDCTLIQKTYDGWETTDWWWLALGSRCSSGVQSIITEET